MRSVVHLSPTSLSKFYENQEEFYLTYMADDRPPKIPQTPPMAIGSAFDAYVKSYMHQAIFGKDNNPKYNLEALFTAQVEPQNRDASREAGEYLFGLYKQSGCLADIMLELQASPIEPRFELDIKGVIEGKREGIFKGIAGLMFLGKPDVFFMNKLGARVVLDWKVNGFYSNSNISPMQGYVRLRQEANGKWANKGHHKNAMVMMHKGMLINVANYLENFNEDWAQQLSIYAWLLGEDVGADFIAAVDQVVCKQNYVRKFPDIRFAEHRLRISKDFQNNVYNRAAAAWEIIQSGHFFRSMSEEDSRSRCKQLDAMAASLRGDGTSNDTWFSQAVRV